MCLSCSTGGSSAATCSGHHVSSVCGLYILWTRWGHHQTGLCPLWTNQEHWHVLGFCYNETQGIEPEAASLSTSIKETFFFKFIFDYRALPLWSTMYPRLLSSLWSRWTQSCWADETLRFVVCRCRNVFIGPISVLLTNSPFCVFCVCPFSGACECLGACLFYCMCCCLVYCFHTIIKAV